MAQTAHEAPARLLLVDDSKVSRDTLERRLQAEDIIVEGVANGRQALERLRQPGIDLVLLDMTMPQLDGIGVLREIREAYPASELPVIMLADRADSHGGVHALSLGASDYVTKPIAFPVALARVRTHLGLVRAHRHLIAASRLARDLGEQLRLIMDSAPAVIFVVDRDGRLARANETASDVTGYQDAEMIGTPFAELWAEDDRAAIEEGLSRLTKKGQCLTCPRVRLRRKDGTHRVLDLSLRAIGDNHGPTGFLATAVDSTEAAPDGAPAPDAVAVRHAGAGPRAPAAARTGPPRPAGGEQRAHRRRRTFKGGKVSFHNGSSVVDCVVREMSEGGARLEFDSYFDCPRFVRLHFAGGEVYDCEVSRFTNKVMRARFLKRVMA